MDDLKVIYFNADFAPALHRWFHDPALSHFFRGVVGGLSFQNAAIAPEFLKMHILIGLDKANVPVGMATLADTQSILRIYRAGILVSPSMEQKGYGKTLLKAAEIWAFNYMNADKIFIEILAGDERVRRGAEAAGYVLEGRHRAAQLVEGKRQDEFVFGKLKEEFRA